MSLKYVSNAFLPATVLPGLTQAGQCTVPLNLQAIYQVLALTIHSPRVGGCPFYRRVIRTRLLPARQHQAYYPTTGCYAPPHVLTVFSLVLIGYKQDRQDKIVHTIWKSSENTTLATLLQTWLITF